MSAAHKRPRVCDSCRKKKVRCEGLNPSGGPCPTCVLYSVDCTYNDHLKPPRPRGYVQQLESRIANLERVLHEARVVLLLHRNAALTQQQFSSRGGTEDSSSPNPRVSGGKRGLGPLPASAFSKPEDMDPLSLPAEERTDVSDDEFFSVSETSLGTVSQEPNSEQTSRFYGKSSFLAFTTRALDERLGEASLTNVNRAHGYRQEFWVTPDWLTPILTPKSVYFEFPTMDLLRHLVDCYFENIGPIFPILHRPSFVRLIQQRLHKTSQGFGAVVLLVCAIGCRFTDDPRVIQAISPYSPCTAWKLFHQVKDAQKHHYLPHSLYEAQIYPLTAFFLEEYSPPDSTWMVVAVGLRIMQDAGVHRKSFSSQTILSTELWKRSFWTLIIYDRYWSTILGRPCALQDEDFDADLPVLCDEEDLEGSGLEQPPRRDRPDQICSFICTIKLYQILAFTLRTVYSTKRSRVLFGYVGKQWEQRLIATLGSALNRWLESVPEHLRWDSETSKKEGVFLVQSIYLRCQFHEIQLHVHREFAFRDPPDPELSKPSLVVCKNAAVRCISILDSVKDLLLAPVCYVGLMRPIFASTAFLIIFSWKTEGVRDDSQEHSAIETGINLINLISERCRAFVCLRNILRVLRGLTDGSYGEWVPRVEDLYRLQLEAIMHVDKNGFVSSPTGHGGLRSRTGTRIVDPLASMTMKPGSKQPNTGGSGSSPAEPTQLEGFSPIDFAKSTLFPFGIPGVSTLAEGEGLGQPLGGSHGNNDSSILPVELVLYNDLMMNIGESAKFFEKDFMDSLLLGSAPLLGMEGASAGLGTGFTAPNTVPGHWEDTIFEDFHFPK